MDDEAWMAVAAKQAAAGLGSTYPNPCVGAVLVRGHKKLAAAHSDATGGPHAEVEALRAAGSKARGATLYVTLEPCCHVGRTGRCTDAILEAGVARVVVGIVDPARHVAGKGITRLRRAGTKVEVGVGRAVCERVHEHYLHHERNGVPFVSLKAAISIDGRIATGAGDSKWITSEASRRRGHRLRAEHHAIAVGLQTVLADDPGLDVRLVRGTDPIRIVFDSRLQLARHTSRRVVAEGTWVVHGPNASSKARAALRDRGLTLLEVDVNEQRRVDVTAALVALGRRQIRSVLVEGGGTLLGSFVNASAWQRMFVFQAPVLLGQGRPMLAGPSPDRVADAPRLVLERRHKIGDDQLSVYVPAAQEPR